MNRQRVLIAVGILLSVLVVGLVWSLRTREPGMIANQLTPLPSPVPSPLPRPDYTPVPADSVSPVVVQRSPERGEELSPDGAIQLVFDRAMDPASVEAAFRVNPAVTGKLEWVDTRTVLFKPAQPLQHASTFDVVLGQQAKATDGAGMNGAYQFRFATAGYLEVGQVIPGDAAQDVEAESVITVMFNRPVVPLLTTGDQSALPQPLTFEPAIKGSGEWLNTSVYVFKPAEPLAGGISYTARVAADLKDLAGNPFQSQFSWRFATIAPKVLFVAPEPASKLVSVEPTISLQFNQPVDQASAEKAFELRGPDGSAVPGTLRVLSDTLTFTPTTRLQFDQRYEIGVAAGLTGRSGGQGMATPFSAAFQTVPLPKILKTEPADGNRAAEPYSSFSLVFNAPINPDTVMANLVMTPPLSPTQVYTYFSTYDNTFVLNFDIKPSSDYAVQIGPNIADPYGNTTGQNLNVSFRTKALLPSVSMVAPAPVGMYNAANPPRIGLSSVNQPSASLSLHRLDPAALQKPYFEWNENFQATARQLRAWQVTLNTPLDQTRYTQVELLENAGKLEPGTYMVQLNQPGGNRPQTHLMVVSDISLTLKGGERDALAWANRISDGQPVSGLAVEFLDDQGKALGSATTDSQGVARLKLNRTSNNGLMAVSRQPFAAMNLSWSDSSSLWEFGVNSRLDLPELTAHIYTERTIYRPGHSVNFKGIVRAEDDVAFSLPKSLPQVEVLITDASGQQVYKEQRPLNPNGTFEGSLKLADGAALGMYSISVTAGGTGFSAAFQVAAYRAPEFEVKVTPQSKAVVRGTATNATVKVNYFFGGPVANVPVEWNVVASSYDFAPEWAGRYQFNASDDPWYCGRCWWITPPPPAPLLSGTGTTNAQGQLSINLPAELKDSAGKPITNSLTLVIEASVTGKDSQVIAGREELVVHRADYYIGLAAQSYVAKAGEEQTIDIVTANTTAQRLPAQNLELEVYKVTWNNRFVARDQGGSWESQEVRSFVTRQALTTDGNAAGTFRWTPAEPGSYQVIARGRDGSGREVRTALFVWVSGDTFVPWRRDNADQFTLISDKTSYKPGETATILIPSPFQGPHWALITVERGGVLSYEVRRMESNSSIYQLPLTASHAPNVYVSVVLISPPGATGGSPSAEYKLGLLPLEVAPEPQSLRVTLKPDRERAEPGQEVRYSVDVTDLSGKPVAGELSLDLVDKAVLSLAPRTPNAIGEAFYARRGLGIATASSVALSAERFQAELAEELLRQQERDEEQRRQKGGGTRSDEFSTINEGLADSAATTAPTAGAPPAMPEAAADSARSVAGNQQAPAPVIRGEFADTAFWNAVVATDANGRGEVSLKLPDNLTTWVMRGVAVTGDTLVGEGSVDLIATRPLLVRPVTPRFFIVDDQVEIGANVSNNTATPLDVQIGLATTGLSVTTKLTQTVQIPANGEAQVNWIVVAQDAEQADLVFTAISGTYSDASRPRLATGPNGTLLIHRYSVPEIVGTGGQLEAAGSRTEAIGLPRELDERKGELTVRIDPSLAAGMRESLEYLEDYDYESVESVISSFLPNVLTARALKTLAIPDKALEARLPGLIDTGLRKLALYQNSDGGWGWWQGDESNPHLSAYAVFSLTRAKEAGWRVDDGLLQRGLDYLATQLGEVRDLNTPAEANQQAWLLYVMAEAGRSDTARMNTLFDQREKLGSYARALLALGLNKAGVAPGDPQIKTLLADLNNAAILSATGSHWEEANYDRWSMNTDTRSTAIILAALVRLDPENQLNPNVVRWLMVARKAGIWETSQESAWALIALTDWMVKTGELKADYDYTVWVNEREQAKGHISQADVSTPIVLRLAVRDLLSDAGNLLTIARGAGPGRVYYTAHLRAYLPVESVKPLDRGVSVRRRYTLASCTAGPKCPEVSQVKVGDVIRVELSVTAPHDLYYLKVEDPIAAGTEIIDTTLATTSIMAPPPSLEPDQPGGIMIDTPMLPSRGVAEASVGISDWYWRWWNWYSHTESRDDRVALFTDYLAKGAYSYSYTIRATLPGTFHVIPTTANETYFPEVYGRSAGQLLQIER